MRRVALAVGVARTPSARAFCVRNSTCGGMALSGVGLSARLWSTQRRALAALKAVPGRNSGFGLRSDPPIGDDRYVGSYLAAGIQPVGSGHPPVRPQGLHPNLEQGDPDGSLDRAQVRPLLSQIQLSWAAAPVRCACQPAPFGVITWSARLITSPCIGLESEAAPET